MKSRHAAAFALVGFVVAVAFFIWFKTRNPLLGRWKPLATPTQYDANGTRIPVFTQCGGFDEIDFSRDKVTLINRDHSTVQPPELRNAPPSSWTYPATYSHEGNRYLVTRPTLKDTMVFIVNNDGLMFCGDDGPDNNCFGGCHLISTHSLILPTPHVEWPRSATRN